MTILVLFQGISPAQTYETADRASSASTSLSSGRSELLRSYQEGSTRSIKPLGNRDKGQPCDHGDRYRGDRDSLQAEELGRSYARHVENTSKLITDPVIIEYVNRVAENLASLAEVQVIVKIVDTDEVNAFSLPGGFIFINSGLILAADNEAELAAVITHEIGHLAACHSSQEMVGEETNLGFMPRFLRFAMRPMTLSTPYLKPSRNFESEADLLGIEYLYKAGYDPAAASSFLEKVKRIEKQKHGDSAISFESRSLIADRIKRTGRWINMRPRAPEYKLDSPDFQNVKKRLFELDGHESSRKHSGDGPLLTSSSPQHSR